MLAKIGTEYYSSIKVAGFAVLLLLVQRTLAYPALLGPGCVRIIEMSR